MPSDSHATGAPLRAAAPPRNAALGAIMLVLAALAPWIIGSDRVSSIPASGGMYWSAEIDKRVNAYAQGLPHPRILLIGGSSITFGLNPASLSRRVGMPVVAYGVTASLGMDAIARRACTLVGPGDLVVLAPELPHFSRRTTPIDPAIRAEWLRTVQPDATDPYSHFPMRFAAVAGGRWRHLFVRAESSITTKLASARDASPVYSLDGLNSEGTVKAVRPGRDALYRPAGAPLQPHAYNLETSVGARAMDLVIDRCRGVGARALFMPSIRTGDDMMTSRDTKLVHAREQDLIDLAKRKGFTILLPAAATSLPSEFGFNTGYHLNDAGVAAMEDILAAALTRAMKESPPAPPPR